uniref:Uncharacterized protein n=1 Tax=Vitis vinifera TaxID=29760 RepID=A5ADJ6_VITVI|nr:hypothetical protein VITISV_017557 [Vitis vinifera]
MDLKFKGIAWVGNIYQKFEAICQEVDNIVSQDPVKYVENHVQTGCESMKKFCSDVVQELLPSSVDPVEHEDEAVPLKQNDENRTYIKSLTGIEENLVDIDFKELSVGLDAFGPMEKVWADGLSFSGLHLVVDELMPELSMNSIEGEEFSLSLGENGDVPINENPDVDVEENFKKEKPSSHQVLGLNSCGEKDLCEPSLSSEYVDENHENAQDPVKHVENQVQTGGESMKKFCSDVVQELLTPSVDPVEHEAEAVPLKQNDENRTYIKSLTGIEENLVDTDAKELPVDLDAIGPMENAWADGLSFSELHLIVELMPELSMNSIEGEEFSLSLVENGDVPKYENPDVGVEENFKKEKPFSHQVLGLKSCGEKDLYEPSFSSESVDKNHENTQVILSEVSPVCLVHGEGLKSHEELGSNCAVETEFVSDYLNAPLSSELACSVESCEDKASACSVYGERFRSLQKIGTTSDNPANETKCISDHLSMVWSSGLASSVESCEIKTPTCSVHGEEFQSLQNVGKICSNSADETESISDHLSTLRSSELASSVESCEKKTPGCSVHGEGFQSPQKLGTTCSNSADETDSASDPSNPLLSAEQVLSVETCGNKALVCSAHCEGFQSPQKFGTTCIKSADETDCASDPLNPLLSAEQVLLVETCENKAPACSVHGEGFQLPQKLGTSCSNSADETDCASDPSNPPLYAEQVLLVETCEIKTPACSVHGEGFQSPQKLGTSCSNSADETDCASDPLNPLLSAEQVLPVETCENKAPACSVHCEGFQLPLEKLGTSCSNSADETDSASDPLNPLLSTEQVLPVETYENKAPACSVHGEGFQSPEKLGKTCSDSADETGCASDPLNPLPSAEQVLSVETCENKAATLSVHDGGFQSSKKLGTTCSDSEDETDCVSDRLSTLLSSEHSSESKIANMELVYSSNSLATEAYDLSKLSPANFLIKEEKICNPVGDALCVPDVPSNLPSFNSVPIAPYLNGSAETGHASLCGVESNGLDTSKINDTAPQSGSTGNKCDQSWESTQLEAFISFQLGQSGDSGDDISGMDTIELFDKVGPEDECVFVDNKELYAVSRRLRELRSYRKRIQDAFTSKKRRAKEYEQLAIWYGDVDGGSSQNTQNLLPPSTTEQVHIKKPPTHDSCDSEWELL